MQSSANAPAAAAPTRHLLPPPAEYVLRRTITAVRQEKPTAQGLRYFALLEGHLFLAQPLQPVCPGCVACRLLLC